MKMHLAQKSTLVIVALSSLFLASCASILSDSKYPVTVNSEPSGATVTIRKKSDGTTVHQARTPATVTLAAGRGYFKSESYVLDFNKSGYPSRSYELNATMDGWYAGNLLFGGLIGILIVDPVTGAMWKLEKNVVVNLNHSTASNTTSSGLQIVEIDNAPAAWKEHMVAVKQ